MMGLSILLSSRVKSCYFIIQHPDLSDHLIAIVLDVNGVILSHQRPLSDVVIRFSIRQQSSRIAMVDRAICVQYSGLINSVTH